MCQAKADGGRRCTPTITFRAARSLRGKIERSGDPDGSLWQQLSSLDDAREMYGSIVAPHHLDLPGPVKSILNNIRGHGHNPLIVGGTIRDSMLDGTAPKDFDIEVYGTDIDGLAADLRASGYHVDEVGKSFGVLKVRSHGEDFDISVPRTDSKTGDGHRGFDVETSQNLSVAEASSRRDFTINAIMYDAQHGVRIDPHGGAEDLRNGTLRHISDAYGDDVLRPLRGFQFAGRFGMDMHPDTAELSRSLYPQVPNLATERIAGEWEKFYRKSTDPSRGLKVLDEMGWNGHVPGLEGRNTPELRSRLDSARNVISRDKVGGDDKLHLLAGTVARTMPQEERYRFLKATIDVKKTRSTVNTMLDTKLDPDTPEASYREAADRLGSAKTSIRNWARMEEANGNRDAKKVLANAERYGVADEAEAHYVMGRDVITATTRKPGPWITELLDTLKQEQYERKITGRENALARMKELLNQGDRT